MNILFSLAAGVAIGLFFYGGLWLTIRWLIAARHPVLIAIASFWGRTILALAAFLFIARGQWQNAVAALAGFALGRLATSQFLPTGGQPRCN